MNDPHSNPLRSSADFLALCEQLQDRSLSYSDRESLVEDAKSHHYQIQFSITRKRNCYSSGPDGTYRDGITLEGSLSDSEASVRVSFNAEGKAELESMQEDDSVSAVVLLERWSSGLREWEAWAIDRQTDESPVIPTTPEDHTEQDATKDAESVEVKAHSDSDDESMPENASEPALEDVATTKSESESETVIEQADELDTHADAEDTVEPKLSSEDQTLVSQEDLAAAAAIFETAPPSDYIGEIIAAVKDGLEGTDPGDSPSTLLTPQEIVDDTTAVVSVETSSRPRVGTKENPVPTMSRGAGCFCILYTVLEVCLTPILAEERVALIIGGLPYVFVLLHLITYCWKFRTLGPEHGYTAVADTKCRILIKIYSLILLFHVLFAAAGRIRF